MNEKNNREKNNRKKNNREKNNQVGGQINRMNANNNKAKNKPAIVSGNLQPKKQESMLKSR